MMQKAGTIKRKHGILNILYPRRCPVCHRILPDQTGLVCPDCEKTLRPIEQPFCMKCGAPVREGEEFCMECRKTEHRFTCGRGIFSYNDVWKQSIEKYKYYGCREYGDFYADKMARHGARDVRRWGPDLLVSVPLHRKKLRIRGFNQSWYLAERIGRILRIPAEESAVVKVRETKSQKKLAVPERRNNLKGAFAAAIPVAGKRILVVDDIYTTGSTMDAMADCLLKAGAAEVFFLTFCIVAECS